MGLHSCSESVIISCGSGELGTFPETWEVTVAGTAGLGPGHAAGACKGRACSVDATAGGGCGAARAHACHGLLAAAGRALPQVGPQHLVPAPHLPPGAPPLAPLMHGGGAPHWVAPLKRFAGLTCRHGHARVAHVSVRCTTQLRIDSCWCL